jgi:hypothetical protein
VDINQIYRAPSISKLSKRNISSSLIRGASNISSISSAPKLKSSSFSFKSKSDEQKAQILSSTSVNVDNEEKNNILSETLKFQSETLSETNRILVEIQKQLSLDFAMRIAEEKEIVKKIKATESKKRFSEKEASVEGLKRGGGAIKTIFDKLITTPAKNILDKIKEFFSLILTGIVYNAAFKWLQDKNNRKLLDQIFDWIGKAFIPAVIAIIGFKVFKWVRRLVLLGRWLWKLPGRILKSRLFPRSGPVPPNGNATVRTPRPKLSKFVPPASPPIARPALSNPLLGSNGVPIRNADPLGAYKGAGSAPGRAPAIPKTKFGNISAKSGSNVGRGGLIGTIALTAAQFFLPQIQDVVGEIYNSMGIGMNEYSNKDLKKEFIEVSQQFNTYNDAQAKLPGGGDPISIEEYDFGRLRFLRDEMKKRNLAFSQGGTVPGKGPGNVDSVKANLAPGEEVIRTQSAMQFRPLLKDINDNAGRLWVTFTQAITKLFSVSAYQNEVSSEFSKVIKDFDKYLKDEIIKNKNKKPNKPSGGSGATGSYQKTNPSISSSPKVTNINMISQQSGGGMTFLPMNLPPIRSKPPEISMPKDKATDVPVISSVNMANPYMQLTPEIYGIFV